MSSVEDKLLQECKTKGVVPFSRFMELALYCPNSGFYEQEADNIGRAGHYFTSVSVGTVFGELLAVQFAEWLLEISAGNQQSRLHIVESGAHDGRLARDVLSFLNSTFPVLTQQLEYWIIEPSHRRREWQQKTLRNFAQMRWAASLEESQKSLGAVRGVIFSNEFLDALPVHRLGWDAHKKGWFVWGVGVRDDKLHWTRIQRTDEPVPDVPDELRNILPDGFIAEVCPAATDYWCQAATALECGKLMTIDYGHTRVEAFLPERASGTLRAYQNHRLSSDVLACPGQQDITAHVNFSALQQAGERCGLRTEQLSSQEKFLNGIVAKVLAKGSGCIERTPAKMRQLQTLTHPEHLGTRFRALVQSREVRQQLIS